MEKLKILSINKSEINPNIYNLINKEDAIYKGLSTINDEYIYYQSMLTDIDQSELSLAENDELIVFVRFAKDCKYIMIVDN